MRKLVDKNIFNTGGCSSFAEVFFERFKEKIPSLELAVVRGKVKMDDYEEYGDVEWEDCHAVVMLDDEYYFDADGLIKFDSESDKFGFSNDTLEVQLISLNDKKYNIYDYSIYREYDGADDSFLLGKSIHATFGVMQDGKSDLEECNDYREDATKYINENADFFNNETSKGIEITKDKELSKFVESYEYITSQVPTKEEIEEALKEFSKGKILNSQLG